jgi:L-arabinonolactonase
MEPGVMPEHFPDIRIFDTPACLLGEGPVWVADQASLYWTDIHGKRLYRFIADTSETEFWILPERLGSFALLESGDFIGAFETGIACFSLPDIQPEWIVRPYRKNSGIRFNDGKTSPDGRFFVGSMNEAGKQKLGELWSVSGKGTVEKILDGICISNSLAWSPDGAILYLADSVDRRIMKYRYDRASGQISDGSVHVELSGYKGVPDGSATDIVGNLYTAMYGGSCLIRTTPSGDIDAVISLPVPQPTCCAFSGRKMTTLFITSAIENLSAETIAEFPASGRILSLETEIPGILPPRANLTPR